METPEEKLPESIEVNLLQEGKIEPGIQINRFVSLLAKTGLRLFLISVFVFFFVLIFMSHTYSYHL